MDIHQQKWLVECELAKYVGWSGVCELLGIKYRDEEEVQLVVTRTSNG